VFVQDLSQLKAVYPKWQTFLANSAKQFFRVSDYDTAKYISEYLGEQTVSYFTDNETEDALGIGRGRKVGRGEAVKGRRLLTPDEVMRIPETILLLRSEKPYKVFSLNYLRDSDYRGRYSENRLEALS
jgi:type IV secretion system protein VirD4